jgi:hypothetical protein
MDPQTATPGATPASGAMPDESGRAGQQATPPAKGGEPEPKAPAKGGEAEEPQLGDAGKQALAEERNARRAAEKRAEKAEAALKDRQDADLSESEKKDRKIADLERLIADKDRTHQERITRAETIRHAAKLGYRDPDDAHRLLDPAAIEYDDDGQPKNVEALLTELLKAKPYLAAASARAQGDFGGGARGGQPTQPETLEDAITAHYGK